MQYCFPIFLNCSLCFLPPLISQCFPIFFELRCAAQALASFQAQRFSTLSKLRFLFIFYCAIQAQFQHNALSSCAECAPLASRPAAQAGTLFGTLTALLQRSADFHHALGLGNAYIFF